MQFSASEAPQTSNMLESGNQVFTGTSFSQTDTTDYSARLRPTSTDCTLSASGAGTLAIGGVCALYCRIHAHNLRQRQLTLSPSTAISRTPRLSTPSSDRAHAHRPGNSAGFHNHARCLLAGCRRFTARPVTLSATVSGGSVTPSGTVVFTVDSSTYNATLDATARQLRWSRTHRRLAQHFRRVHQHQRLRIGHVDHCDAGCRPSDADCHVDDAGGHHIRHGAERRAARRQRSMWRACSRTRRAAGAVLDAGTQTLSVLFTPDGLQPTTSPLAKPCSLQSTRLRHP